MFLDTARAAGGSQLERLLAFTIASRGGGSSTLDLSPLAGSALEEVTVYGRHAKLRGLSTLAKLPALRHLDLSQSEVEDPDELVAHCPRDLVALSLPEGLAAKHLKELFPGMTALRYLRPNNVPAQALLTLAPLAQLEALDLTAADGNRRSTLPSLPGLRILATNVGTRTADLADTVANTPQLEELSLEHASLDDISFVRGWKKLKHLVLASTAKLKEIGPLAALQALELLDLSSSNSTRDLQPLASCQSLRQVSLRRSGACYLEALLACPRLEVVYTDVKTLKIKKGKGVCIQARP